MLATRTRLSFSGDWLAAAVFLAATVFVGLLVVRELRGVPPAFARATAAPTSTADAVPADAVSVPTLMLGPGNEVRVGDSEADATARLGSGFALVRSVSETGPLGPRQVRSYEYAGTRFILVVEPFERRGAPRVAAIYLQ